jgi:hypothetical protein
MTSGVADWDGVYGDVRSQIWGQVRVGDCVAMHETTPETRSGRGAGSKLGTMSSTTSAGAMSRTMSATTSRTTPGATSGTTGTAPWTTSSQQRRGGRTRCRPCCSCSTSSYLNSAATRTTHTYDLGLTIGQGNHGHTTRASNTHKCSQPVLHPLFCVVWWNRCQSCLAKDPIQLTRIHTKYSLIPNNIS